MKKVLCLIGSMNAGGAETFLMKVYRMIDKSKYQMDFCVNVQEKGYYDDEIYALGGKIFHIPSKSENVKAFKKQLADIIQKEKYEYVFRITSNCAGFMDLKIAKKAGARVCSARSSNSSDGNSIKAKIVHRLGRWLYGKYVDVKFAPSVLAAEYTFGRKAVSKGQLSLLHNGVDLNVFHFDQAGRENIRKEFGVSPSQTVIGHIGRFAEQKNHDFLLDIFYQIYTQDNNAVLLLVGKGELENQIREKIKALGLEQNVIFAGVRSDVPQLLSAMDVFVFPSFYEGMPNTVIEAQATGLPCIIADTITKEADITGLVQYLSLKDTSEKWASFALNAISKERKDTKSDFINNKYDIESVAQEFVRLVFDE